MRLHTTTLVELTADERALLRDAGDSWARTQPKVEPRSAYAGRHKLVARALGTTPRAIVSYERAERKPSLAVLERWCALIGVSELDLRLCDRVRMPVPSTAEPAGWQNGVQ